MMLRRTQQILSSALLCFLPGWLTGAKIRSTGFHFYVLFTAHHVLWQLFPTAPDSVKGYGLQTELHSFTVYGALCQTKYLPKVTAGHNEQKCLYGDADRSVLSIDFHSAVMFFIRQNDGLLNYLFV